MAKKICIMICEAFKREATAVIESEEFDNVSVITYPTAKLHVRMGWEDVIKNLQTIQDSCQIIFLGGGCIVGLGPYPKELNECYYYDLNQCFDMFIGKSIMKSYIKQGAYLLSPSWLKSWRKHMEEYNFDKNKAQKFFKNTNIKLLLLDTGVYENISNELREFAEFVDLPFEILPVGLDFFTLFLKKNILEWRLSETKIDNFNKKIGDLLSSFEIDTKPSIIEEEKKQVILLLMNWDDKRGPSLASYFPIGTESSDSVEKIGFQLFKGVESIYGQNNIHEAQGILLNIENIQKQGYTFFDSIIDLKARGGERPLMIAIIAPKINYFESLKIKEIFKVIAHKIKDGLDWNIKDYWEKILRILSTPVI